MLLKELQEGVTYKRWEVVAGKHPTLGDVCEVYYSPKDRFKIPRIMCKDPCKFMDWANAQSFSDDNKARLLIRVSYILAWE